MSAASASSGSPLARLARRLGVPDGALPVAVGGVVSGVTAYVFLVVTARMLGPVRYSALASLWTATYLVGPGVFSPLEQEVCRAMVARRSQGLGDRPVVRRCGQVGAAIGVVLLVAVAAGALPLTHRVFGGDGVLVVALALSLSGYYFMHFSWGVLAGDHHFRGYGVVAGAEGVIRLAIVAVIVVVGTHSLGWYGLAIGLAPFGAAFCGWRSDRVVLLDSPPEPIGPSARAIGHLLGGSAAKQFLLMIGPLAVQVLAGSGEKGEAGRFLAAVSLTRVPLFLFNAVLAALLPALAAMATDGRRAEFVSSLRRLALVVVALIATVMVGAAVVGPALLRLFFGGVYALPAATLVLLAAACGAYLMALVLSYGLIAVKGHALVAVSWVTGCAAFVAFVAATASLGLVDRVAWGFLVGTGLTVVVMAASLTWKHARHPWDGVTDPSAERAPSSSTPV
jgi:O-antigen/teichoic acid export membrane protein